MGAAFTAKDFRTWGATLAAMRGLARSGAAPAAERSRVRVLNEVVREVAAELSNTPTVCRSAYIDPVVFEGWRQGGLERYAVRCRGQRHWERAALSFLGRAHRTPRAGRAG
jgi:DNA topoisomerase IB